MLIRAFAISAALVFGGQAFAIEPSDLAGVWTTEWSNAADEAPSGGGPMLVSLDSDDDTLDGMTPAAGLDGVMNGEVSEGPDGALIWSGVWVSNWPEDTVRGTFRLVFTDTNTFTGAWSTDDKQVQGAAWNGHRGEVR
jgi:hypothetical protein